MYILAKNVKAYIIKLTRNSTFENLIREREAETGKHPSIHPSIHPSRQTDRQTDMVDRQKVPLSRLSIIEHVFSTLRAYFECALELLH